MFLPELILSKEFKRTFRGYNDVEVDVFLNDILEGYETVYKENELLKSKIEMYSHQVEKYNSIEDTLKETLVTAQSAAEDTTNAANKRARIIVQEAELQAKQMIDSTNNKVVEIKNEYESLLKEFKIFKMKFRSLLQDEIRNVDDIFSDIRTNDEILKSQDDKKDLDTKKVVDVVEKDDEREEKVYFSYLSFSEIEQSKVLSLEETHKDIITLEDFEKEEIFETDEFDSIEEPEIVGAEDEELEEESVIVETEDEEQEEESVIVETEDEELEEEPEFLEPKDEEIDEILFDVQEIDSSNKSSLDASELGIVSAEDLGEYVEYFENEEIDYFENEEFESSDYEETEYVEDKDIETIKELEAISFESKESKVNTESSIADFIIEKYPSENDFSSVPDIEKTVDIFRKVERELVNANDEEKINNLFDLDLIAMSLSGNSKENSVDFHEEGLPIFEELHDKEQVEDELIDSVDKSNEENKEESETKSDEGVVENIDLNSEEEENPEFAALK